MDNNLRLLVHAGASSTRQDDDQRVVQVAAYLDLEPTLASRTQILWPSDSYGSSTILQDRNPGTQNAQLEESSEEPGSTTFIDDTQLAYTLLESQLFTSPAGTKRPTPAKRPSHEACVSSTAPAPVPGKPVRLSGSPDILPHTFQRESYLEPFCSESERLVTSTEQAAPAEQQPSQPKPNAKTQTTEGTITSNDTTSELPNSYSLGDVSDGLHSRPQLSERSTSDPGPSPARQGGIRADASEFQSQRSLLRDRQHPFETSHGPTFVQNPVKHSVETISQSIEDVVTKYLPPEVAFTQNLSTSIEPAGPVTSIEPFTTHITATLQKLAQNPELSATFLPTAVGRNLSVHERGYWEVQCQNWNSELQMSFWETLESVVGTGKAGWGVRCTRGPEVPLCSQSIQQNGQGRGTDPETSFSPVRVYCWGEIVKHIYLLLFVASNSKVRKLGLQWIDAQGLVVIQMRTG